jgi:hypothetical protein
MVHPVSARDVQRPLPLPARTDRQRELSSIHTPYLLVPDALILAFAHDPLSIGVYVAVARLTLTARGAVPVAARDLTAWMGSDRDADRAAIMRRIVRLAEHGWLRIDRDLAAKHHLLPTWGNDGSGKLRPWRFDREFYGKPEHLRGRRIPFALLDTYIGRLETRPGQLRGLISRYFTRPMLDLTDVGVFTISLRCEIEPTPRLIHLGLVHQHGLLVLPDWSTLLTKVERGELTTIHEGKPIQIHLSMQGRAKLATLPTLCDVTEESPANTQGASGVGSGAGSTIRSLEGSLNESAKDDPSQRVIPQHNGKNTAINESKALIAWEDGSFHESINQESSPEREHDGGVLQQGISPFDQTADTFAAEAERAAADAYASAKSPILPAIVMGHETLNPDRSILPGEWHELYHLQQEHGTEQLLIWQSRALRMSQSRSYGITPGYYRACATRQNAHQEGALPQANTPHKSTSVGGKQATLDPACDALLRQLGVRARQQLVDVPLHLIMEWQTALAHPGIAVRFTSPLGFAVNQMKCGNVPPTAEELDQWAKQATRGTDRYQSWQFFQQEAPDPVEDKAILDLEQRVRAIAPPDATIAELCAVADLIEAGHSDQDARAAVLRMRSGATP